MLFGMVRGSVFGIIVDDLKREIMRSGKVHGSDNWWETRDFLSWNDYLRVILNMDGSPEDKCDLTYAILKTKVKSNLNVNCLWQKIMQLFKKN